MVRPRNEADRDWSRKLVRFYVLAVLVIASLCCLYWAVAEQATPDAQQTIRLDKALFVFSSEYRDSPPPPDANWQEVRLPHRIDSSEYGSQDGYGWYLLEQGIHQSTQLSAIYLARAGMNAEIYLNGNLEGYFGPMQGAKAERNWNRPFMVSVGEGLNHSPSNQVAVQVRAYPYYLSGMSSVWIGPAESLRSTYQTRMLLQQSTLSVANAFVLGAIVILIALACFPATRRPYLLWLILGCLLWTIRNYSFLLNNPLLPHDLYSRFIQFCMLAFASLLLRAVIDYCRVPGKSLVRFVWGLATATFPILLLSNSDWVMVTVFIYGLLTVVGLLWSSIALFRQGQLQRSLRVHFFSVSLFCLMLLGTNDLLFLTGLFPFDWYLLGQQMGLIIFLSLTVFLTSDYAGTIEQGQNFNDQLRFRLAEQEKALEAKHQKLEVAMKETVRLEERSRLMTDMHDGTGAYLVAALHHARNADCKDPALEALLEDCLRDLQLTVDSLEPVEEDLSVLVGAFRYRITPNLDKAGLKLNWNVARNLNPLNDMDPRKSLHILRMLQEVFSNILKHSHATKIDFILENEKSGNVIVIRDNGRGFEPSEVQGGRGLSNLQHRANQIRANLSIESSKGKGTAVKLMLHPQL